MHVHAHLPRNLSVCLSVIGPSALRWFRKHPHNCGAAPKSGHAVTARGNRVPDAVAAAPARGRRTRSPPGSRVGRARFTRGPRPVHAGGGRGDRVIRPPPHAVTAAVNRPPGPRMRSPRPPPAVTASPSHTLHTVHAGGGTAHAGGGTATRAGARPPRAGAGTVTACGRTASPRVQVSAVAPRVGFEIENCKFPIQCTTLSAR